MKEQIHEPLFTLSLEHKTNIITYGWHKSHNNQTEEESYSANDPTVEGTGDYNKEQSMFQLAVICLGNRNKHSENEWKAIQAVQSCH